MSKGDRSQPTRARLLDAALKLMGRDQHLSDMGLRREHVATAAGFARNTLDYHFPTAEKLVAGLIAEHRQRMLGIVEQQAGRYELGSEFAAKIGPEAVREMLRTALDDDLPTYLPGPDDPASVGRERLYWMCVALADRNTPSGSPDVGAELRESNTQTQLHYSSAYRSILQLLGRVPNTGERDEDFARVQRLAKCFLEGTIVHRRLGMHWENDDVIDGFLGLVFSLTEPI